MRDSVRGPLIFVMALLGYVLFNGAIAVTDPVESNYALTAKEMVLSGDWLSPRIYGQYWFDKPIMIYWLIAVSYKLFGINEFAARFPSGVFSAASVALTYWFANKVYHNRQTALMAALVLATSLEFWVLARMIITDAVLLFFNSAAMAWLYLGLSGRGTKWYWAAYVAAGLAVLTKGPVGIVLPGITLFVYIVVRRQWQLLLRLYIVRGLALFLLVAAPWYVLMYLAHGRDFVDTFLGLHNYLRATVSEHPKDNVFYYYLVLFPISMLPWSGLLFKFLGAIRREIRSPLESYLVVWPGVMLAFYTLMATKYPTYVFPASFPAAILLGNILSTMRHSAKRREWLWLSLPAAAMAIALLFGAAYIPTASGRIVLYVTAAAAVAWLLWLQLRGRVQRLPEAVALTVTVLSLVLVCTALAPLAGTRSAKELAKALPPDDYIMASYGEYATSMVFYSSHIMSQLVDDQAAVGKSNVWSGKYTMPTESFADFAARARVQPAYLVVKGRDQKQQPAQLLELSFVPLISHSNMTLYQRQVR